MLKPLARLILFVTGWKVVGSIPDDLKKAVMIAAPHTSYWDFVYARAAFFILDIPLKITIKKEAVYSPWYGWIARKMGAIAIDRTPLSDGMKRTISMVEAMVDLIRKEDQLIMMITPEGTRKYVNRWKTGFYRVAEQAGVPIILGYLDYSKKHAGVGPVIFPSGNYNSQLEEIQKFYRAKKGKYPDQGVL